MKSDIIRTIRDNIQHIGHFHTAGNPGRNELDETQELYYPAIMRAIAATDYDEYVGQEFVPRVSTDVGGGVGGDVEGVWDMMWPSRGGSTTDNGTIGANRTGNHVSGSHKMRSRGDY